MKVVLLQDSKGLGKKYDVKDVSDGHALNFLIPRGIAQVASDALVKKVEKLKAEDADKRRKGEEMLAASLDEVKGTPIEIIEKANEKGSLFSAIHKAEIVAAVKKATGIELAPEFIKLDKPIKQTGDHVIEVQAAGKAVKIKVAVKAA